jgi:two-component system chemotaxis response regulator CheB
MRKAICNMLASDPRLAVVETARNGEEAIQKVAELHPDVMTLDVEMPGMNGLEALRKIMEIRPLPVIMVSSLTEEGAQETLTALDLGAVDYISKQLDGVSTNITAIQQELIGKVVAAAGTAGKISRPRNGVLRSIPPLALSAATVNATRGSKVVAIGCSTGGPKALQELLPRFPKDFPAGVLIVQHMPKYFTKPFAERMNQLCQVEVREAADGDLVTSGVALVAPGGLQMRVARKGALEVEVKLSPNVEGLLHTPSVDILMQSVAEVYPGRGIGVILTGMGHDGLEGMKAIKRANGRTVAQDEASCVVYGMPKAVVDGGYADKVVPLPHIAGEIVNMI